MYCCEHYLSNKDVELKRKLLQKRYDNLRLETLQEQKTAVDMCLKSLKPFESKPREDIFLESLTTEVKNLAAVGLTSDEDYVDRWYRSKECYFPVSTNTLECLITKNTWGIQLISWLFHR